MKLLPPTEEGKKPEGVTDSTKPVADALKLTGRLLTQAYGALVPSVGATAAGQDWQSLARATAAQLRAYLDTSIAILRTSFWEAGCAPTPM